MDKVTSALAYLETQGYDPVYLRLFADGSGAFVDCEGQAIIEFGFTDGQFKTAADAARHILEGGCSRWAHGISRNNSPT